VRGRPPSSPLFPYTTLFRSMQDRQRKTAARQGRREVQRATDVARHQRVWRVAAQVLQQRREQRVRQGGVGEEHFAGGAAAARRRSEEHTSELQSRENLVCRL